VPGTISGCPYRQYAPSRPKGALSDVRIELLVVSS
jgi:hypothetical protein